MTKAIIDNANTRMDKAIDALNSELKTVRTGRANPTILDRVAVDYWGEMTPINQVANISVQEGRSLVIKPYDRSTLKSIERAILEADLGFNPQNDGQIIRIVIPPLTQDRRKELSKQVSKIGEQSKVAIRNIRRDANDTFKKMNKANELTEDDLKKHSGNPHDGLDHYEKKWLQIGIATQNKEILSDFQSDMVGDVYLDIDGIKKEMQTWQFPLHFIDFETSAVALPFYDKMRPYEQVAFQFSHHRVDRNDDGTYTITHAGQFINTTPGLFPNFDFIRALKAELDKDQGTIFRYSHHENTILREIHRQLDVHDAPDKRELQAFIDSITHYKVGSGKSEVTYAGVRDMVDLAAVVYKYYYHPLMNGGFSIKVVLPSVLNSSDFIKAKYSQPIYGTPEMPSSNLSSPKSWIEYGEE